MMMAIFNVSEEVWLRGHDVQIKWLCSGGDSTEKLENHGGGLVC